MIKKGQVTIFVIIAILLVAGIAAFFVVREKMKTAEPQIPVEIKPVYDFVQNCLKETAENGLVRIGEQGGYFIIPENVSSIGGRIPYYLSGEEEKILKQEEIEQNLVGFVKEELGFCVLNFKDFRNQWTITNELNKSEVKIFDNRVRFSLYYLLTITKDKTSYQLKDFSVDIPVRLGIINRVSEELITEQLLHPESICLSCLYKLGENYKVHIDLLDYGNSTIFTIRDDNSKINNESYEFSFVVK